MASRGMIDRLEEFTLEEVKSTGKDLGRGAYGKVFTVKYLGLVCAAKEIHALLLDGVSPQEKKAIKDGFIRECIRCNAIRHPNIVQFLGMYYSSAQSELPIMVMELMDTSLNSFVENNKSQIALKSKFSMLYDVSLGLSYLHGRKPPVIHRDLSSNNVLLNSHLVAKISDLGMAKMIRADSKQTKSRLTTAPGTLHFMPPETFDEIDPVYGTPVDVFSFAGIALHVFSEEWPTPTRPVKKDPKTKMLVGLSEAQRRQAYLDKMTGGAAVLKPLIEKCLENEPEDRPLIEEVAEVIEPLKATQLEVQKLTSQFKGARVTTPNMESPPLVEALQTKQYHLKWDKCSDLPRSLYAASVVVDDNNVYVTAGGAPEDETHNNVYQYNITTDQWNILPPPGHRFGVLCAVDNRLSIFGGSDSVTRKYHNKVSTYNRDTNSWSQTYPGMIHERFKPGVVVHGDHLMVMGGQDESRKYLDSIETMNWQQISPWREVSTKLPVPMWNIKPTIAGEHLLIVGYSTDGGRSTRSLQLPVSTITSSSDQVASQWKKLSPAPHHFTTTVPSSNPPLIIGGDDVKGVATSDISLYDTSKKSWIQVDNLTTARSFVGVATINSNTIIVVGGIGGGVGVEAAMSSSLPIVEIGHIVHN
ncbi:probable serine/threonine-protein kinase DDB_G0271402 isoform X3 [Dysidea avara]|uniref:probable serine/threonine-protein kinase DDB_G0271402 isoform X3 n=1 Tax=Dysidea avara TaxID=196820 RepID=UPI003329D785